MAAKFETLIEHIVSGNTEKARAIFHTIVVDRSRKIYEDLDVDRAFDDVETDHVGYEDHDEIGGDESEDFQTDVMVDGEDMQDDSEFSGDTDVNLDDSERISDIETSVDDLESHFAELEAEFQKLLDGDVEEKEDEAEDFESFEDESEDESEDIEDSLDSAEDEFEEEEEEVEKEDAEEDESKLQESLLREYVLSVTKDLPSAKESEGVNKKSPIADKRPKLNGVDAHNIAQAESATKSDKKPEVKEIVTDEEIQNRPGRKTVTLKKVTKPAEKEGKGINTKSVEA